MLSIYPMSRDSEDYYLGLAAEDYYLQGGEPPGKWIGQGAEMLTLRGTVSPDDFRKLFRGWHPATTRNRSSKMPENRTVSPAGTSHSPARRA